MALDRQSIEKKDFPIGRRGYDPEAVDAHLHALADEIDELKRSSRRRSESLAAAASEQVRSIVEAAETSAADIQRQAEDEAREIRAEASTEAEATREHATSEAREYVGRVSGVDVGDARADRRDGERAERADRVAPDRLEPAERRPPAARGQPDRGQERGRPAAGSSSPSTRPPAAPARGRAPDEPPATAPPVFDGGGAGHRRGRRRGPERTRGRRARELEAAARPNGGDDDGARLIALNMALNGTPREETDRYLAENFKLTDRRGLLDEVYSSVEG